MVFAPCWSALTEACRRLAAIESKRRMCAWAVLFAVLIAAAATLLLSTRDSSSLMQGDFPAFYSLAVIADSDTPALLYDLDRQIAVQNQFWPSLQGSVLPGAYPPYVAYLLRPLARLPWGWARTLWTLGSLFAFWMAVRIVNSFQGAEARRTPQIAALLLLFPPCFLGVLGGQLFAFSLLLYAAIVAIESRRSVWAEFAIGVLIGVWLFKPHYAAMTLGVFLAQRRWGVLPGFLLMAGVFHLLGCLALGSNWILEWGHFTRGFAEMNLQSNASQMPNLLGGVRALVELFTQARWARQSAMVVGLIGCSSVLGMVLVIALRRGSQGVQCGAPKVSAALLLLGPALALGSPQANFYDLGLAGVPLMALGTAQLADHRAYQGWLKRYSLCVVWGAVALLARPTQIPLFPPLALAIFMWVCAEVRHRKCGDSGRVPHSALPV